MSNESLEHDVTALATEIIDRIATDAEFREAMKVSPQLAMSSAGYADRVDAAIDDFESSEVQGFMTIGPALQVFSRDLLRGGTIVASAFPSSGCCGASSSGGGSGQSRGTGFGH